MTTTPAMKQYYELKKQNKDSILFFRMWDFYEMFDEDAHIAHKVLWINITTRNKNAKEPIPLAGIPYHAKDKYLPRLIEAWYKVAVVEQKSDPKLKWIVKREVVRVITPATINLEEENYKTSNLNYIVSISEENGRYWLSFLESSSFVWKTWELKSLKELSSEIYKISPKEVILEKKLFLETDLKNIFSKKYSLNIYYYDFIWDSKKILLNHFWVKNLEWFWLEDKHLSQKSSSQLLNYLKENQKSELKNLDSISYETFSDYMDLDETTIKSLDLIYNISTNSSTVWTLFWILDQTETSMWKRLLRENILKPLKLKKQIEKRLNFIEELLKDKILLDKINKKLKEIADIDNIITKLALNRVIPRDLINLKRSLKSIIEIYNLIKWSKNNKLIKILKI